MVNKFSVRDSNHAKFIKVISLRKQGHSYKEIAKIVPVAKSTINNWITLAGLNLSQEHLQIQTKKRLENHAIGTIASRLTKARKREEEIQKIIEKHKRFFNDPFYNYGIALYETEGSKGTVCKFSNSDYRLIQMFIKFIETYFSLNRQKNMSFELFIHKTRKADLEKIVGFWLKKLRISKDSIKIYWKRNIIVKRRINPDYVGQIQVRVSGERILSSKLLVISDIILRKYKKLYWEVV